MLRAFLGMVRLDTAPNAEVDVGLSLASIEAKATDRLAMRLMGRLPDWLLKTAGVDRILGGLGKKLAASSSGLCAIVAPDSSQATDLLVGRSMQRAWLALTACGLATQPMMSGPVLDNVLELGPGDLVAALGREKLVGMRDEFRAQIPECQDGRLAVLLRFGYAQEVSGRTGRLPTFTVTTETALGRLEKQNTESTGS